MKQDVKDVHPRLIIRYREAISHALLPVNPATATIVLNNGKALSEEASVMVGPDGACWMWFVTKDVEYFSIFMTQNATPVAISGTLADGRQIQANECYFEMVDMHGKEGTAQHDATGWRINLTNPAEFTVLLKLARGLHVRAGDPISEECQVEYTLLNAVFDGTERTQYDAGKSIRMDAFSVKTGARQWKLRSRRDVSKEEKAALDMATVAFLPTATASAELASTHSLTGMDEEAHVICFLMSLATGAATRWTSRHVYSDEGSESWYAGYRPPTGLRNRKFYELVSNHQPERGLESLLSQCVDAYQSTRNKYRLDRAIGYLEETRIQQVVDVQLVLAILAVESLTHYWCLDDGLSEDQLKKMNIEAKIDRMAKAYPGIQRKVLQTDLLRSDVRNPLMHMGEIPALTLDELVSWAERLYVLAFRIILTFVGYTGTFVDMTRDRSKHVASLA